MSVIIQWNIRGFAANRESLQLLCSELEPSVVALQETLVRESSALSLKHYNIIERAPTPTERGMTGGVALLIHSSLLYSPVDLDTVLQASAARVTFNYKTIAILCEPGVFLSVLSN